MIWNLVWPLMSGRSEVHSYSHLCYIIQSPQTGLPWLNNKSFVCKWKPTTLLLHSEGLHDWRNESKAKPWKLRRFLLLSQENKCKAFSAVLYFLWQQSSLRAVSRSRYWVGVGVKWHKIMTLVQTPNQIHCLRKNNETVTSIIYITQTCHWLNDAMTSYYG